MTEGYSVHLYQLVRGVAAVLLGSAGAANSSPLILDGIGPTMTTADVQLRFPRAICTKSEMKLGNQRSRIEHCRADGDFAGRKAEYIVTFAEGRMDGVGVILRSSDDARVIARKVLSELTTLYGQPAEHHPGVLELKNPEFEELALWIEKPKALVVLRVCHPVTAGASLTCPDRRVIINASYSR